MSVHARNVLGGIARKTGGTRATVLPSSWGFTRYASNPIITVNPGNPSEATEQYVPAAIKIGSALWCYVKGTSVIYAWKSTNDGLTWVLQNSGSAVLSPGSGGSWDDGFVIEPVVVYDAANTTIHLWYKGYNSGAAVSGWGHATAPDSTPTVFTKDAGNPILTEATVSTALSGATVSDLSPGDVILIDSTFHFYGYCFVTDRYRLIQATGSTWNNPSGVSSILTASNTTTHKVVQTPGVIRVPGVGTPLYAMFYADGAAQPGSRTIRMGSSANGSTWDFSDTTDILSPTGSGWEQDETYSGHFLKVSTSPWAAPLFDTTGRWKYFYSGLDNGGTHHANTGFVYMVPVWI